MEKKIEKIQDGIQQVVSELYNEKGFIKPSDLVEAARPSDSPAHGGFLWDNKKAGNEYRLIQARQWIDRKSVV